MTLLGMVMGFTVIARAGERPYPLHPPPKLTAELAAGKCAAADKVVLRERLAHEIARDGVRATIRSPYWNSTCAVDIACCSCGLRHLSRPVYLHDVAVPLHAITCA